MLLSSCLCQGEIFRCSYTWQLRAGVPWTEWRNDLVSDLRLQTSWLPQSHTNRHAEHHVCGPKPDYTCSFCQKYQPQRVQTVNLCFCSQSQSAMTARSSESCTFMALEQTCGGACHVAVAASYQRTRPDMHPSKPARLLTTHPVSIKAYLAPATSHMPTNNSGETSRIQPQFDITRFQDWTRGCMRLDGPEDKTWVTRYRNRVTIDVTSTSYSIQ